MPTLLNDFQKIIKEYVNAREREQFAGHEFGDLFRHQLPELLEKYIKNDTNFDINQYQIKGSIGLGNWAKIPWLAILNKNITTTTQKGVYIVYLFSENMESLYLTFNQGITKTPKEEFIENRDKLRKTMDLKDFRVDNNIDLAESGKGKQYELSNICYRKYEAEDILNNNISETKLKSDLFKMIEIYKDYYLNYYNKENKNEEVKEKGEEMNDNLSLSNKEKVNRIKNYIKAKGFTYPEEMIENFYLSLKTKPFVLLAGISGTGKTKLVQLFSEAIGCTSTNGQFKLISVKPDWSDSSDLLGYSNIRGDFQAGPMIKFIKTAMEDLDKPYIICLDEMNLARVEYYFSEFLSKMETRRYYNGKIITDKLLDKDDFEKEEDAKKYAGLYIPQNLYIIGTVNMDETTHPFSKKVLDRANTIEFNEIELMAYQKNNYDSSNLETFSVNNSFLVTENIHLEETLIENKEIVNNITQRLTKINEILEEANLQVGYRIRDEVNFYIIQSLNSDILDKNTAFDKQIMQKILPRIQGSSRRIKNVLKKLFKYTTDKDYTTENGDISEDMLKYYRDNKDNIKYPCSTEKIVYMLKKYEEDGFTAYWL